MAKGSFRTITWRRPGVLRAKFVAVLGAGWLILALALPVLGDVAPPDQAPGSSIGPAGATQVRMLAEQVILDIQPSKPNQDNRSLADDYALAQVNATFQMRNLGQANETMPVRFPLEAPLDFGNIAPVAGFTVKVNDQPVTTTIISDRLRANDPEIQWAAFDVTFPSSQDVTLKVSYQTRPTGYLPFARFDYLLETGAGWRDTIGSVDMIARLPYPASAENVLLGPDRTNAGASYQTTPGGEFVGNEVRWHWDNLEPTSADNLFVNILLPQTWQRIVAARAAVEVKPDDGQALQDRMTGKGNFPRRCKDSYVITVVRFWRRLYKGRFRIVHLRR